MWLTQGNEWNKMAGMDASVIALMTDFGDDDFFVASLKGTILKINPEASIIDITHRVPSFDIRTAAFILSSCYGYFPKKTIFLVVVDPGVGSERPILLVETEDYFFIAPDNGVLSMVMEEEDVLQVRHVTNETYYLSKVTQTFEARDKMAPVAAAFSTGIPGDKFGPEVNHYEKIEMTKPEIKDNEIWGQVLYTDKFGNLITNIPERQIQRFREKHKDEELILHVQGVEISRHEESYSSVEKGEMLFLVGSLGLLEIACREGSAADKIKAKAGDAVKIYTQPRRQQ